MYSYPIFSNLHEEHPIIQKTWIGFCIVQCYLFRLCSSLLIQTVVKVAYNFIEPWLFLSNSNPAWNSTWTIELTLIGRSRSWICFPIRSEKVFNLPRFLGSPCFSESVCPNNNNPHVILMYRKCLSGFEFEKSEGWVSGMFLNVVLKVSGRCLSGVWKVSKRCLETNLTPAA